MRVAKPQDLPDFRLWLLDQWRPPDGLFFKTAIMVAGMGAHLGPDVIPLEPEFDSNALRLASLWWVSADMARLVQHAANTLPPTTLTRELVPDDFGLVVFEEPLMGTSGDSGDPLPINAIVWGSNTKLLGDMLCLTASSYQSFYYDGPVRIEHWGPCGRSDWEYGTDTEAVILQEADAVRLNSISEDRRWLAALWLLSSQSLAETTRAPIPRATVRRSARAKLPSDVRLVNIRAPKRAPSSGDDERPVDWSHRWIVGGEHGGFWRQQAYGPNRSLRRPKWIREYIKGPPDKPLRVKDTVRVVRSDPAREER